MPTKPSPSTLQFLYGVAACAIAIPAAFWFLFDDLRFGLALGGFLLLLILAIQFLAGPAAIPVTTPAPESHPHPTPKLHPTHGPNQPTPKLKLNPLQFLPVIWLLAIPFAPFLAWVIGSVATVNLHTWRWIYATKAVLCVALPLICVLPMLVPLLLSFRGRAAPYALLILVLGTAFPVSVGYPSTADLLRGPQWQPVTVTDVTRVHLIGRGRDIATRTLKLRLSDGRTVEADADQVHVTEGPCRILVLTSSGQILAIQP